MGGPLCQIPHPNSCLRRTHNTHWEPAEREGGASKYKEEITEQATQERITRGGDPEEGGPGGEQECTNRTPGYDNCGDKGVFVFWNNQRMTIFDVRIADVTAASYEGGSTNQTLHEGENTKKRKHLQACLESHQKFTPLVFSAEGCMGRALLVRTRLPLKNKRAS